MVAPAFSSNEVWDRVKKSGKTLQCHFDINGVVLGQETIKGKRTPPEKYASIMLANGTYARWAKGGKETSYKLHVWNTLLPGPNSDQALRAKRKEALRSFVRTLKETGHPLTHKVQAQYNLLVRILNDSPVFPGLARLIHTLRRKDVPHYFVFRTFGGDGAVVKAHLAKHFPDIKLRQGKFGEDGIFKVVGEADEHVIKDPEEFRRYIREGHWLIQDSFHRWRKNGESGNFGKFFPFSSNPKDPTISMFADDNLEIVESGEQRTIVSCYDAAKKKHVSTQEARHRLMKINPVRAALEKDHLLTRIAHTTERLLGRAQPANRPESAKGTQIRALLSLAVLITGLYMAYSYQHSSR